MLGWSIRARACRSASKRAMTWRLSMPGLMHLEGDLAPDRLALLGHEDDAHAAFADLLQQLVRADDRAGPFPRCGFSGDSGPRTARRSKKPLARTWLSISSSTSLRSSASPPQARSTNWRRSASDSISKASARIDSIWSERSMIEGLSHNHPLSMRKKPVGPAQRISNELAAARRIQRPSILRYNQDRA